MKKAVLRGYVIILLVGILLCAAVSAIIFDLKITETTQSDMRTIVTAMAVGLKESGDLDEEALRLSKAAGGKRVTIIAQDGTVEADSVYDADSMENHGNRTEIKQANYQKVGTVIRESETLGYKMIYAATKTPGGYYLRVSGEYAGLLADFLSFLPAMIGAVLFAILIATILANRFARSVSAPIASLSQSLMGVKDGSVSLTPENYPYEELQDMAQGINQLSGIIKINVGKLKEEKNKIDYILDNMNEGFVLLDKGETVLIINQSACQFFKCDKSVVGRSFLRVTRNMEFINGVERAMKAAKTITFDTVSEGRIMEADIYVVTEDKYDEFSGGIIILLSDVTASRDAVKMRREFFSNASHELKTPITSIKGFSEMLVSDIALDPAQKREFINRIASETERMNVLINDIIMISRMESGDVLEEAFEMDFASIVHECLEESQPLAAAEGVRILSNMEPCLITADRKDLYALASNLITNAVKYNKKNGKVKITLDNCNDHLLFQVYNEGDFIPEEKQGRIFERFYRLDHGRTKTVGGTGLGLAIVKHVVERYHGTVELTSAMEEGTTFTVNLPK